MAIGIDRCPDVAMTNPISDTLHPLGEIIDPGYITNRHRELLKKAEQYRDFNNISDNKFEIILHLFSIERSCIIFLDFV